LEVIAFRVFDRGHLCQGPMSYIVLVCSKQVRSVANFANIYIQELKSKQ